MKEVIESFKDSIKERLTSPLYGWFSLSWCFFNWKAIYVTFFIDQSLIVNLHQQLKIDYLLSIYSSEPFWWSITQLFFGPMLFAWLFLWPFSVVDLFFFKKSLRNRYQKEKEIFLQQKNLEKTKGEFLQKKQENIETEKKVEMTLEERWEAEYQKIKQNKKFNVIFDAFRKCLYQYDGFIRVTDDYENNVIFQMHPDYLALLDVNGLIEFNAPKTILNATEKGKFFIRKYLQTA